MKGMSVCHINNELDLNTVRRTSKKKTRIIEKIKAICMLVLAKKKQQPKLVVF